MSNTIKIFMVFPTIKLSIRPIPVSNQTYRSEIRFALFRQWHILRQDQTCMFKVIWVVIPEFITAYLCQPMERIFLSISRWTMNISMIKNNIIWMSVWWAISVKVKWVTLTRIEWRPHLNIWTPNSFNNSLGITSPNRHSWIIAEGSSLLLVCMVVQDSKIREQLLSIWCHQVWIYNSW